VRPKYRDSQPAGVQEAFQFLLATAMHEAGKFELLNVVEVDGQWHYTYEGAGEVSSVVRPEMDKEMERKVIVSLFAPFLPGVNQVLLVWNPCTYDTTPGRLGVNC